MAFCGLLSTNVAAGSLRPSWPVFVLRHHEAVLERGGPLRRAARIVERLAGVAAVADHVEAAVPLGGQVDFERNLRRETAADAAVLRRIGIGGNDPRD